MGQAFYRKHRPKKLSDVIGQEHITSALQNAIKTGRISHAYLLTGPKGVGKTSVARILAHEVNGLPYEDEATHLDIIEIDAASNRRIDEIRDLRDKVHIAPSSGKYKVYIIDEVHMLTREAFNALLKTLEEPPAHVIFILATTEAHKLPETIISRTQRFSFKPIDKKLAVDHLKSIAKVEKIEAEPAALELIAEHGDGSFRDSISLLDQVATTADKLTLGDVRQMLGIAPEEELDKLVSALQSGSSSRLLQALTDLSQLGLPPANIAKQLGARLRHELLAEPQTLQSGKLELLTRLIDVPTSSRPELLLELILLDEVFKHQRPSLQPVAKIDQLPEMIEDITPGPNEIFEEQPETISEGGVEPATQATTKPTASFHLKNWTEVLGVLKKRHSTLYSVARMCLPKMDGADLVLAFRFPFHQKQMMEAKNRAKLDAVMTELFGNPINVKCVVDPNIKLPVEKVVSGTNPPSEIDTISNIFGGAEVLES